MTTSQRLMEAAKLRLRLQMNARLRLEVLAAIARVFREYRDPLTDELLSTLVLAVPEELLGEAELGSRSKYRRLNPATPPPSRHAKGAKRSRRLQSRSS